MKLNELPMKAKGILVGYIFWSFIHIYIYIIADTNYSYADEYFYPNGYGGSFQTKYYDFSEFFFYTVFPLVILAALYILVGKDKILEKLKE
jgi:hypothetical protein